MPDTQSDRAYSMGQSRRRLQVLSGTAIALSLLTVPLSCAKSVNSASLQSQDIFEPAEVRPLPGQLDSVPMFNSDSPEWVKTPGVLLSTFPSEGKSVPSAHLNYAFTGPFTLFTHHVKLQRFRSFGALYGCTTPIMKVMC